MTGCEIHWSTATPYDDEDVELLAETERARLRMIRLVEDQQRFVSATLLLRRAVGAAVKLHPREVEVDRLCRTCGRHHGRPELPGTGLWASLTHAGAVVGVALTKAGPVGLDVEPAPTRDLLPLAATVCGAGEEVRTSLDLLHYWTRKESLIKATGDGLRADLTQVLVSGPNEETRLRSYAGRPGLVAQLMTPSGVPGHVASVAVLTSATVEFHEMWRPA